MGTASAARIGGLTFLIAALAHSSPAPANDLYIEQITTDSTVTISQTGGNGNVIAGPGTASGTAGNLAISFPTPSADDPMKLSGANLSATLTQQGANNTLGVDISAPSGSTVTFTQDGQLNEGRLVMNGSDNTVTMTVTGNSNKTNIEIGTSGTEANETTVSATITGNTNQLDLQHKPSATPSSGAVSSYTLSVTGGSNAVRIENTGTEASTMAVTLGSVASPASGNVISITKGN